MSPSTYSPTPMMHRQHLPIEPWKVFLAALVYLFINFISAPVSILYGSALAAWIIWKARPEYLPALLILQTNRSNYILAGYGTWEHSAQRFFDNAVIIAGFPVSITYVIAAVVLLRVCYELFMHPETFHRAGLTWLFIPWGIGLGLAAVMTYQAFAIGNPSWTVNIRVFMMLGGIFYGMVIMRFWRGQGQWLITWMVPLIGIFFWLAAFGRFSHHNLWFMTGLSIPLAWLAFRQPGLIGKLTAMVCAGGAVFYASGLAPGLALVSEERADYAAGLLGTGTSTFTLNFILFLAIVVSLIAALPKGKFRSAISWFLGLPAFVTIVVFSIGVAIASPHFHNVAAAGWSVSHADMTPVERFNAKLFNDRSIIWSGILEDVLSGDYIFRPAGSPVIFNHPRHGSIVWTAGAHNAILEALRSHRWIGGSIVILFLLISMMRCAEVIGKPVPASLRATAAGIIAFGIVISVTGHMHVSGEPAFWYFTLSGIIIAAIAEVKARAKAGLPALPSEPVTRRRPVSRPIGLPRPAFGMRR